MAHGNSTASSMSEVVNQLMNTDHCKALDMPLDMSAEIMFEKAVAMVKEIDEGKGVLLLTDMGSLTMMGELIEQKTGIKVRTITLASTAIVLEALRKSLMQDMSLDEIYADLKQALLFFAKEMFGPDTKIRLRPSYFPFTEPSAEMDISCNLCGGKGCSFCKHTGWVEILGCGMVDPNVLESCGIDSKIYTGYALGMGIERITNLKYQVKDLRMFSENDQRFLEEFESAH